MKATRKKVQATVVSPKLHSFCGDLFPLNKFEVCGYPSQGEPSPEIEDNAGNSWYVQSFSHLNNLVILIDPSCGRYAKICYFFEPEHNKEKMFHARWYEHGSQTILQEVAEGWIQHLYLLTLEKHT